jgi:hypothetical protein
MASTDLEPLEAAVLDKLLAGNHPVLAALRGQLEGLRVKQREHTGAGFYTEFSVATTAAPAPAAQLRFGDVQAAIRGLEHGAGFLLYVDGGVLTMLEGYSFEEPWPEEITAFSVDYLDPDRTSTLASLEGGPA